MTSTTLNKDYAKIYHDAPPLERLRVWLTNLYHWRTAWAVRHLSKQLQNDPEFRQSWHANIAMPIYDATRRECDCRAAYINADHLDTCDSVTCLRIDDCNRIADRLMKHLFNA